VKRTLRCNKSTQTILLSVSIEISALEITNKKFTPTGKTACSLVNEHLLRLIFLTSQKMTDEEIRNRLKTLVKLRKFERIFHLIERRNVPIEKKLRPMVRQRFSVKKYGGNL